MKYQRPSVKSFVKKAAMIDDLMLDYSRAEMNRNMAEKERLLSSILRMFEQRAQGNSDLLAEITHLRTRQSPPPFRALDTLKYEINKAQPPMLSQPPSWLRKKTDKPYQSLTTVEIPEGPKNVPTKPLEVSEEGILPPSELGGTREVGERGVAEDYLGPDKKIGVIQELIEQIRLQQPGKVTDFPDGWAKGYRGIEFGDQVLLVSIAPMRINPDTGISGVGNRAFKLPQQIEGVNWKDYLLGRNPENKKPTKSDLKDKIDSGAIKGEWYNRGQAVISLLKQIVNSEVEASLKSKIEKFAVILQTKGFEVEAGSLRKLIK